MALLRDNPTFSLLISEAAVNMWYVVECKELDSQSQIQHFWCSFQLFFKEKAKKSTELLPACTTIVLNVNYRISAYFHRIWLLFRNCNILLTQMFKWPKGRKQCSDFVTFWPLFRIHDFNFDFFMRSSDCFSLYIFLRSCSFSPFGYNLLFQPLDYSLSVNLSQKHYKPYFTVGANRGLRVLVHTLKFLIARLARSDPRNRF